MVALARSCLYSQTATSLASHGIYRCPNAFLSVAGQGGLVSVSDLLVASANLVDASSAQRRARLYFGQSEADREAEDRRIGDKVGVYAKYLCSLNGSESVQVA